MLASKYIQRCVQEEERLNRVDGKELLIQELKEDIEKLKLDKENLQAEKEKLLEDIEALKCENKQIKVERDNYEYCLEETRKSFSYRLGFALTSIPRKIRNRK